MRLRAALIFIAVLAAAGLTIALLSGTGRETAADGAPDRPAGLERPADRQAAETSIRNLTRSRISFRLSPSRGHEPPAEEMTVEPGAVCRRRTAVPLEIRFDNGRESLAFTLDPGSAYTFRYDEDDRVQIFLGSHGRLDAADLAPYVPTPQAVVDRMLELAEVKREDVLYDLGCGDGRIVITAARRYGARGVGIDIDAELVRRSKVNAFQAGVTPLVRFLVQDALKSDFREATVVAVYLLPESNELLRPRFEKQLKPGVRVVCHNYTVPGWQGNEIDSEVVLDDEGEEHKIYVYRVGRTGAGGTMAGRPDEKAR